MRRLGVVFALLAIVAGGLWFGRGAIAMALLPGYARDAISRNLTADLPDGLHAFVCGSGSPLADANRAGPCLAVVAGQRVFVVDAGEGAAKSLNLHGIMPGRVDRVLLTHLHSDHIDGLGALALQRWAAGSAKAPLPLIGPEGVQEVAAGLMQAYRIDRGFRIAHHGEAVVPPSGFGLAPQPVPTPERGRPVTVFEADGLKITAFRVDHEPVEPALGYRFEYKGRSLAVSGDTHRSASLEQAARGVDLLVHEALSPELVRVLGKAAADTGQPGLAKIMADIPSYHASPADAAESATAAGAKALLLTHLIPPMPNPALEAPFLGDARNRSDGPLWVARDGDLISLPAGSDAIRRTRIRP